MIITKNFHAYIKKRLVFFNIGGGLSEYERAKKLIIDDSYTDDEVQQAIIIISEWCEV